MPSRFFTPRERREEPYELLGGGSWPSTQEPLYRAPSEPPGLVDGAVKVPLLKALITSGFATALVLAVLLLALVMSDELDLRLFLVCPALTFPVVGGLMWWSFQQRWQYVFEQSLRNRGILFDLNQDGYYGDPEEEEEEEVRGEQRTVRVEITEDHGNRTRTHILGFEDRLGELARGLLGGVTFSEGNWTPKHEKLFSQDEFRILQQQWVDNGLALWRSTTHQSGVRLTEEGWAAVDALAHGDEGGGNTPLLRQAVPPDGFRGIPK